MERCPPPLSPPLPATNHFVAVDSESDAEVNCVTECLPRCFVARVRDVHIETEGESGVTQVCNYRRAFDPFGSGSRFDFAPSKGCGAPLSVTYEAVWEDRETRQTERSRLLSAAKSKSVIDDNASGLASRAVYCHASSSDWSLPCSPGSGGCE
jgi:hypothetical protein